MLPLQPGRLGGRGRTPLPPFSLVPEGLGPKRGGSKLEGGFGLWGRTLPRLLPMLAAEPGKQRVLSLPNSGLTWGQRCPLPVNLVAS